MANRFTNGLPNIEKLRYLDNGLTDRHEIWNGDFYINPFHMRLVIHLNLTIERIDRYKCAIASDWWLLSPHGNGETVSFTIFFVGHAVNEIGELWQHISRTGVGKKGGLTEEALLYVA